VAVSDSGGLVATPHGVFVRTGDDAVDQGALAAMIIGLDAEHVVFGLPLSLDGSTGPAAQWAIGEAEALRSLLDIPLELHDERLSTLTARRAPSLGGRRSARGKPVDGHAAAVMLQSWLDGARSAGPGPSGPLSGKAGPGG
ncbi:MAG: Holliday junction resolvase RuvX, partial [Acidimicrobiales bacterium]